MWQKQTSPKKSVLRTLHNWSQCRKSVLLNYRRSILWAYPVEDRIRQMTILEDSGRNSSIVIKRVQYEGVKRTSENKLIFKKIRAQQKRWSSFGASREKIMTKSEKFCGVILKFNENSLKLKDRSTLRQQKPCFHCLKKLNSS